MPADVAFGRADAFALSDAGQGMGAMRAEVGAASADLESTLDRTSIHQPPPRMARRVFLFCAIVFDPAAKKLYRPKNRAA